MSQDKADRAMNVAMEHHRASRLALAEEGYRRVLSSQPNRPDALHLLGVVAGQCGRFEEATKLIASAIANSPANPIYYCDLGGFLQKLGKLDAAIASFQRALALKPDFAMVHYNLARVYETTGQRDRAAARYLQALSLDPSLVEAHINLGLIYKAEGNFDQAIACFERAIKAKPDYVPAHLTFGTLWHELREYDLALVSYRQALRIDPKCIDAHIGIGVVLGKMHELDDAIESLERALAIKPDAVRALIPLSGHLTSVGRLDESVACSRRALEIEPNSTRAHDNLLFTLLFHPLTTPQSLLKECRRWNDVHAEPLKKLIQPLTNDRTSDRRLRIGYVSPNFRAHPIGRFMVPLLKAHNAGEVEVFCYADIPVPDDITQLLKSHAHVWRDITGASDEAVAQLIREDHIDILVDLALHLANSRLLVFARKPAPIQVTWLGYPGTTGLNAIDYRVTDPYLDPPDMDASVYSEQTIRLPDTFWCFDPIVPDPPVSPAPFLQNNFVTFGCLNNFCKVTPQALSLWARIMTEIPDSRLILLTPQGRARHHVLHHFAQKHVAAGRIEFVARQPRPLYLETFGRIDIALDTLSYNGHTTTLDGLWMGVPIVTLVGQTVVSRGGFSQLTNLGLPELIAHTSEDYVRIARELAGDPVRLTELRSTLRSRMENSALMDAPRFARGIQATYRDIWRTWCRQ
jgi:predicted O-linked N-acetylglucosamine transferase (SPINDLY family)